MGTIEPFNLPKLAIMLNTSDNLTCGEMYRIAEDCGICLDAEETLEDHFLVWRCAVMFDRTAVIYVDTDGQMVCYVNGCTAKNSIFNPPLPPNQGGLIWRWFLKAWAEMVEEVGDGLECFLTIEDGDGDYESRVKIFEKMGFKFTDQFKDIMRYNPY